MFFIDVLGRVVREGYDSHLADLTSQERINFKHCVEKVMREVISAICHCLNEHPAREHLTPKCLHFLREAAGQIPAFELFNSNLVDQLTVLLDHQHHHELALEVVKEVFCFRESKDGREYQPKFAKKLFMVLEKLLDRCALGDPNDKGRRIVRNSDKQS
jgi:hypothetical protein